MLMRSTVLPLVYQAKPRSCYQDDMMVVKGVVNDGVDNVSLISTFVETSLTGMVCATLFLFGVAVVQDVHPVTVSVSSFSVFFSLLSIVTVVGGLADCF